MQAGDTMAMWLPECSEKHVAQLAAARIGMVVAEVDPKLASAEAVEKILEESGAAVRAGTGGGISGAGAACCVLLSLFIFYNWLVVGIRSSIVEPRTDIKRY